MTLKLFMAICIAGLDVLIYILFQWTLGEKNRTRRSRLKAKRRLETEPFVVHPQRQNGPKRANILPYPTNRLPKQIRPHEDCATENPVTEEMAYRRRAAAFAAWK
jgi:hypothetical protein